MPIHSPTPLARKFQNPKIVQNQEPSGSGGFLLAGADDVLFKATLPKYQHVQEEKSVTVARSSILSFAGKEEERI